MKKYTDILKEFFTEDVINDIINRWNEPHRYWHTMEHLKNTLMLIDVHFDNDHTSDIYKNFVIAAFIHDVIYDTKSDKNEEDSMTYLYDRADKISMVNYNMINEFIYATKSRNIPEDENCRIFWTFDNVIILNGNVGELIDYENKIFKEFQFADYDLYKEKRIQFLRGEVRHNKYIEHLISYIKERKIK